MTVQEYAQKFTRMMRYAPDQTDTKEKKQFWFHRGLKHEIKIILAGEEYPSYMRMVNRALAVVKEQIGKDESLTAKKKRAECQPRFGPPQRSQNRLSSNVMQLDQIRDEDAMRLELEQAHTTDSVIVRCCNCRNIGHQTFECPGKNRKGKIRSGRTPTPSRRAPQPQEAAPESVDHERLNHLIE
ncbi:unnamed protein product [Urochloa humidicola]